MDVDFNILRATMLNWVGRHIHKADIITVDDSGGRDRLVELLQEFTNPTRLDDGMGDCPVFGLGAGTCNSGLTLRRPGNQVVTIENALA